MSDFQGNIVILCSRLDLPGGIERAVVNTANLFVQKGNQVTVLVLDETGKLFYPLDKEVTLIYEQLSFGITPDGNIITRKIKLLSDVLKLRKLLRKISPKLVIASEYPFAVAAALCGIRKTAKVLAWEHHHFYELGKSVFWNRLFRMAYPKLHGVICLNSNEQNLFRQVNNNPVVIPNFITGGVPVNKDSKTILTIARLTKVKGIEYLLKTAREILELHPNWKWKLIGDGELKEDVLQFIKKENLEGRLILQLPSGHQVMEEYQQAAIYVMTSVNECFPMVLLEAQSAGLPCIAFDCETGPRHIINKENGILVETGNTERLRFFTRLLIENESLRRKLGEAALVNSQRYAAEAVYKVWQEKIFNL